MHPELVHNDAYIYIHYYAFMTPGGEPIHFEKQGTNGSFP